MITNKKIIQTLLLLTLSIMLSSCETQIGTAIGSAFTNLITGNGFGSSSGDDAYEKMKAEELKKGADTKTAADLYNDAAGSRCNEGSSLISILNPFSKKNISAIKDKMCTCEAWGTCDGKSCSCDVLCPKNFQILNRSKTAMSDNADDSLSFTNGDSDFYSKYSDYTGFCWGHAVVTQRFNRLAKFLPAVPKTGGDDPIIRQRELKYIIEKLNNNEPVDISGYKNLKDFSSDPEVKELLEDVVKKTWASNAMSTQGLHIVASGEPNPTEDTKKLFDDIEFRLKNNQMPAVVFNDKNNSSDAHTVLVSGSGTTSDGKRYLCIRDNNFNPERSYDCKNKMILAADGTLDYGPWSTKKIGKIELSYSENSNTMEQIANLQSHCKSEKNCSVFYQN